MLLQLCVPWLLLLLGHAFRAVCPCLGKHGRLDSVRYGQSFRKANHGLYENLYHIDIAFDRTILGLFFLTVYLPITAHIHINPYIDWHAIISVLDRIHMDWVR